MDRIGPYRVVRRLGGGAMGEVLEAVDDRLQRPVALKVIAAHLAADPAFRSRFEREARALAALDSPYVVRVHATGEDDGRLWTATALVPDGDLGSWLARHGPLGVDAALEVVEQVAAGLADVHAAGLVHRDVKPGNVLLDRTGGEPRALLGDFGVAGWLAPHQTRTRAGSLGTPAYMAPELHTGGVAGVASDVYALGCVLVAALTGRPPYSGATDYAVARAHVERPVPQLRLPGPRGVAVDRVLRRSLAKRPGARHASAAELRADLLRARALPDSAVGGRGWVAAAVLAALLVGGAGTAYALTRPADPGSPTVAGEPSPTPTPVARDVAVTTLTRALAARMEPPQAACVAEAWVGRAGLQEMAAAGFFDGQWRYVDRPRSAMTPAIRAAATLAALTCADASPSPS
ncbi:serine/threonine-protein kinase [Nocardioides taihuensis]|uniref:non-specific serine/threonine protein kinase n=1 Tax=Nocardioides taihuensis TaxID=1835606 RepID=A0ABW0BGL4_9ACTN